MQRALKDPKIDIWNIFFFSFLTDNKAPIPNDWWQNMSDSATVTGYGSEIALWYWSASNVAIEISKRKNDFIVIV